MTTVEELCANNRKLVDENLKLRKENKELRDNYEQYKAVVEPEIDSLKNEIVNLKGVIESLSEQRDGLNKECIKLEGKVQDWMSEYYELENFMNNKLAEAAEIMRTYMRMGDIIDGIWEMKNVKPFLNEVERLLKKGE